MCSAPSQAVRWSLSVGHVPPKLVLSHLMFTPDPNSLSNWAYTGGLNMSRVPSIDGATDNRLLYMVFLQISPDLWIMQTKNWPTLKAEAFQSCPTICPNYHIFATYTAFHNCLLFWEMRKDCLHSSYRNVCQKATNSCMNNIFVKKLWDNSRVSFT